MATKPTIVNDLTQSQMMDVVNAIRNDASDFYKSQTFAVTNTRDLQRLYAQFQAYDGLYQEFMGILWGRIAKVIITSRVYQNPLAFLKKGVVELGEVIEDAFVNPAKPHIYDETGVDDEATLRREYPDVDTAFYILNYQTFYKTSVFNNDMRKYFLSWDGVESLIAAITESLYNGANQDEFMMFKYMVGRKLLDGGIAVNDIGNFEASPEQSTVGIKYVSNLLTFVSSDYNQAGVKNFTPKSDQFFIMTSKFNAIQDVQVLASAFNMDKVQFLGQSILIDSFGAIDWNRMQMLMKDNPDYKPFTQNEVEMLDSIAGVIVDREWFQVYDNLNQFTEQYNAQKLFWNYFYHVWKTFAVSPFANAVALINGSPKVTTVTVSPGAVTLAVGQGVLLNANVTGTGFINGGVTWSSDNNNVTVNNNGYVYVTPSATTGSATITATSKQDPTVTGTATITIS